jgi:hypothetical protein
MENKRPNLPANNPPTQNLPRRSFSMPKISEMAANLVDTTKEALQQYKQSGVLLAEESVVKNRLTICEQCTFFETYQKRCTKCGCFMQAKAHLQAATCPISKW